MAVVLAKLTRRDHFRVIANSSASPPLALPRSMGLGSMNKYGERSGFDEEDEDRRSGEMTVAEETQVNDPDSSYFPCLSDEVALSILARVPRSEHRNLGLLNRRYRSLVRSGELYFVRKSIGIRELSVLMLASGEHR
ncbi:uncharacterized protein A4U43_C06F4800 [Asparagus officinalis]|uniref:F-box domain-containing protein n=1 Tax=Asparagus officinalis TaxID=4686 RepID=A0A5P1EJK9_ASPOF|nr:uncharacterized protein A4U43_C06F4800 [Asparagus officinalis]